MHWFCLIILVNLDVILSFLFLFSPYLYSAHQGGTAFQHCCHHPVMASKTSTTELARQSLLLGEGGEEEEGKCNFMNKQG